MHCLHNSLLSRLPWFSAREGNPVPEAGSSHDLTTSPPVPEPRPEGRPHAVHAVGKRPSQASLQKLLSERREAGKRNAEQRLLTLPAEIFDHVLSFIPESCQADLAGIRQLCGSTYRNQTTLQKKWNYAQENQEAWVNKNNHWASRLPGELRPLRPIVEAQGIGGQTLEAATQCDAALREGREIAVDDNGLIWEFVLQPDPNMIPARYFRTIIGDIFVSAPAPGDPRREATVDYLLEYVEARHWNMLTTEDGRWKTLLDKLNAALRDDEQPYSGKEVFMRLSKLYDRQFATVPGKEIATLKSGGKVLEFEVIPYDGADPLRLWRDSANSGSLRLAPPAGDAAQQEAVLQSMEQEAQRPARGVRGLAHANQAPDGRIPYMVKRQTANPAPAS